MRALPLLAFVLTACGLSRPEPHSKSSAAPLLVHSVTPVADTSIGPAEADQGEPDITAGPGTERLVVWRDQRNGRFRQNDIYGARVIDGGVIDPLGLPLVSGPVSEASPSVAFDGTTYTLVWTLEQAPPSVAMARFTSPTALSRSELISGQASGVRVAAGGGHTLVVYRYTTGSPLGFLLDADGGRQPLRDGGTTLSFNQSPIAPSTRALQTSWSEAHQAFFVLISNEALGLFLVRVDPSPSDGGFPQQGPPIRLSTTSFQNAATGVELAASTGGALAVLWRRGANIYSLVLPQPPTSDLDLGTELSGSANGTPSVTWTGSRFRIVIPNAGGAEVRELWLDGGTTSLDTLSAFGTGNDYVASPHFMLERELMVSTSGVAGRLGSDLSARSWTEGGVMPTAGAPLTNSAQATHLPVVAWLPDAGSTLVAWSASADGGLLHDVSFRRFRPDAGWASLPGVVGASNRNDTFPRVTWWAGRWWIGTRETTAFLNTYNGHVYSSSESMLNFLPAFSALSSSAPDLESGWLATSDSMGRIEFRPLLGDGGVDTATFLGTQTTAAFPDLAVASSGRPVATSVGWDYSYSASIVGSGASSSTLTAIAGEARQAAVATDGLRFVAVYTNVIGGVMTVERRDAEFFPDGGFGLVGTPVELGRAALIETPSIAFARGQYLVTWSERDDVVRPSRLRMRTLRPEGGAGALVPLDVGAGSDWAARLAVSPRQDLALLAWTKLDAPDAGVPTALVGQVAIGAGLGAICAASSQCTTGACADLVCCETACAEGCGQCSALGVCEPVDFGEPCQHPECRVGTDTCDGTLTRCPNAPAADGTPCSADAGECVLGTCVLLAVPDAGPTDAGAPDAGLDAGVPDAGSPDAGQPDAGEADAGLPDAGTDAGVDAGSPDAGPPDAGDPQGDGGVVPVAPPSDFSHYSWNQGCGCQGGGANALGLLGLFLLRSRRTRRAGAGLVVALTMLVAFPSNAQTGKHLKLSFPGVAAGAGARADDANAIGEFLQTQLVAREVYEVTGSSDLAAMLGVERQKQLLGCDISCAVDIAGALDADRLLTSSLSKVGDSWLLNMSLYDARKNTPIHRVSRRFSGSLERALDEVDPMLAELIAHDGAARAVAGVVEKPAPTSPDSKNQWTVGLRAELEAVGILNGQPAIAPAVFASWGRGMWGAALTVIVMVIPGVRAEGRLHLLEASRVRPLISVGLTVFGAAVAPRGALGVTADLGPVRLSLDAAVEYFVSGPGRFQPLAVLSSAGVAWRF